MDVRTHTRQGGGPPFGYQEDGRYVPRSDDRYRERQDDASSSGTNVTVDTDDLEAYNAHLVNQLNAQRNAFDQLEREFNAFRTSNQNPSPTMATRSKSLYELSQDVKDQVHADYPSGSKLAMLPPQQQQVANMATKIDEQQDSLNLLATVISVTETTNENGRYETVLKQLRKQYLDKVQKIEILKKEVGAAKSLASKFEINLIMPEFETPQAGFRHDPNWMDFRTIQKFTRTFNPATTTDVKFSQFWLKVVHYGQDKFFTEKEYITILTYVLYGDAAVDLQSMIDRKLSLREIVNGLAAMHDDVETIDDHKLKVDNFVRQKNETISKAMTRARMMIEKLSPLHSRAAWPEKSEDMGKAILKQIVDSPTRVMLEMEEQRMIQAGGSLNLHQMTKMAFDHEKYTKSIPTKDVATTFQVASMTPRPTSTRDNEKAHLRQEASLTKSLDETLSKFVQQQQETLQIAAAHYRERGRTPENFSRQKMSGKPPVRSLSENSPRQNGKPIPDGDELMQFEDSPARVDKPKVQPQFKQQVQGERKGQQPQYPQRPQQGPRPQQPGRQWTNRPPQPQPQPSQPQQNWRNQQNGGKKQYPKTMFRPKLMEENGYHYYQCACASWHLEYTPCPVGGYPANEVDFYEEVDDDESEELQPVNDADEEESEN